jgi:hypothetical protein
VIYHRAMAIFHQMCPICPWNSCVMNELGFLKVYFKSLNVCNMWQVKLKTKKIHMKFHAKLVL